MKAILTNLFLGLETAKHQILASVFGYSCVCRKNPSCSRFLMTAIYQQGIIQGCWQSFKRLLTCY